MAALTDRGPGKAVPGMDPYLEAETAAGTPRPPYAVLLPGLARQDLDALAGITPSRTIRWRP